MNLSKSCVPLRDPAEPFGERDHHQLRPAGRVGRRQDQQPVRREPLRQRFHEGRRVGDMLDHLHAGDEVELAFELLHVARAIIDLEPHRRRMLARDGDHFAATRRCPSPSRPAAPAVRRAAPRRSRRRAPSCPSSGARLHSSHCQCWSIWSRTYLSRTGLSLCSIADAPFGSHQSAASLPNCSASSGKRCLSGHHAPPPNRPRPLDPRSPMPRIVMKFGGTSMAGIERIRSVAARVQREAESGQPGAGRRLGDGGRDRPAGAAVPRSRRAPRSHGI